MGRKLGLSLDVVVGAAAAAADAHGIEALSLAGVSERLGVRPPSLFHHVAGLEGLRREVALQAAAKLREALVAAARGRQGSEALIALARAYRSFARRHPGQLAAMLPAPRPGEDDQLYQALAAPLAPILAALAELGIEGDEAIHAIRALRSYLHGFIDLERRGGFGMPQKIETSFERGLQLFVRAVVAPRAARGRAGARRSAPPEGSGRS